MQSCLFTSTLRKYKILQLWQFFGSSSLFSFQISALTIQQPEKPQQPFICFSFIPRNTYPHLGLSLQSRSLKSLNCCFPPTVVVLLSLHAETKYLAEEVKALRGLSTKHERESCYASKQMTSLYINREKTHASGSKENILEEMKLKTEIHQSTYPCSQCFFSHGVHSRVQKSLWKKFLFILEKFRN